MEHNNAWMRMGAADPAEMGTRRNYLGWRSARKQSFQKNFTPIRDDDSERVKTASSSSKKKRFRPWRSLKQMNRRESREKSEHNEKEAEEGDVVRVLFDVPNVSFGVETENLSSNTSSESPLVKKREGGGNVRKSDSPSKSTISQHSEEYLAPLPISRFELDQKVLPTGRGSFAPQQGQPPNEVCFNPDEIDRAASIETEEFDTMSEREPPKRFKVADKVPTQPVYSQRLHPLKLVRTEHNIQSSEPEKLRRNPSLLTESSRTLFPASMFPGEILLKKSRSNFESLRSSLGDSVSDNFSVDDGPIYSPSALDDANMSFVPFGQEVPPAAQFSPIDVMCPAELAEPIGDILCLGDNLLPIPENSYQIEKAKIPSDPPAGDEFGSICRDAKVNVDFCPSFLHPKEMMQFETPNVANKQLAENEAVTPEFWSDPIQFCPKDVPPSPIKHAHTEERANEIFSEAAKDKSIKGVVSQAPVAVAVPVPLDKGDENTSSSDSRQSSRRDISTSSSELEHLDAIVAKWEASASFPSTPARPLTPPHEGCKEVPKLSMQRSRSAAAAYTSQSDPDTAVESKASGWRQFRLRKQTKSPTEDVATIRKVASADPLPPKPDGALSRGGSLHHREKRWTILRKKTTDNEDEDDGDAHDEEDEILPPLHARAAGALALKSIIQGSGNMKDDDESNDEQLLSGSITKLASTADATNDSSSNTSHVHAPSTTLSAVYHDSSSAHSPVESIVKEKGVDMEKALQLGDEAAVEAAMLSALDDTVEGDDVPLVAHSGEDTLRALSPPETEPTSGEGSDESEEVSVFSLEGEMVSMTEDFDEGCEIIFFEEDEDDWQTFPADQTAVRTEKVEEKIFLSFKDMGLADEEPQVNMGAMEEEDPIDVVFLRRILRLLHCLQKERVASCSYFATDSTAQSGFHSDAAFLLVRRDTDRALSMILQCIQSNASDSSELVAETIWKTLQRVRIMLESRDGCLHQILMSFNALITSVVRNYISPLTARHRLKKQQLSRHENIESRIAESRFIPTISDLAEVAGMLTDTDCPGSPRSGVESEPYESTVVKAGLPSWIDMDEVVRLTRILSLVVNLKESTAAEQATLSSLLSANPAERRAFMADLVFSSEKQRDLVQRLVEVDPGQLRNLVQELVVMSPNIEVLQEGIFGGVTQHANNEYFTEKLGDALSLYFEKLHSLEVMLVDEIECCSFSLGPKDIEPHAVLQAAFGNFESIEGLRNHVASLSPAETKEMLLGGIERSMSRKDNQPIKTAGIDLFSWMPSTQRDEIETTDIDFVKRMGRGQFGVTYSGRWEGRKVAVQVSPVNEGNIASCREEVAVLRGLHHPNLVRLLGSACNPNPMALCLVHEHCDSGNLADALVRATPSNFFRLVSSSMAAGIAYLHRQGITHGAVRPTNVILDGNVPSGKFTVKIGGIVRKAGLNRASGQALETGNYRWKAPEAIRHEQYSQHSDVYGYGMTLWQIVTRDDPFSDMSAVEAAAAVSLESARPPFPEDMPTLVAELIESCWADDPQSRPGFDAIVPKLADLEEEALSFSDMQWLEAPLGHHVYSGGRMESAESKHSRFERKGRWSWKPKRKKTNYQEGYF